MSALHTSAFSVAPSRKPKIRAADVRQRVAVISDDLFTMQPEKIKNAKVDITIFDGRVIFERVSRR